MHLCIVSCYPPSNGPLSEYTHHLVRYLASSEEITRITVLADTSDGQSSNNDKVNVIQCWKLDDPKAPIQILKQVLRLKPDIVHFNLIFRQFSANRITNFLGLCTPALCKIFGARVVVTLHSIAEAVDLNAVGYSTSKFNKIGYQLATKLLLHSDKVTVTHRYFARILNEKYHAKNVTHIPHGVFTPPVKNAKYSGKRFLFFGKIGPYKNLELTLEAFREVLKLVPEAELLIAGGSHPLHPGFLEAVLEKYSDIPNVKTIGYVEEGSLERIFANALAVVLPYSVSTWSSGVFTIASTYGRAVIASDLEDFRNLRDEGAGLLLFPKGDRSALANAMISILKDGKLRQTLGELNLQWAARNEFGGVTKKMMSLFDETRKGTVA